jgi:PAS domain S-box-containing protein
MEPKKDDHGLSAPISSPLRTRKETQYRALLEAAPDAIIVVDQSAAIVLVNAQAERLFGYSRDELIGQPAKILVSENFRDQHGHQHSRFLAAPQERPAMAGLELFGLRKDGTEFPIEIRLSPLDTKGGVLISSAIRDISDRRRTEEDLRRLASIVACSDDAIVGKNMEGIMTSWNAAAERIYGYSASEAIGQPVTMLVPLDRPDEVPRLLERLKRGETVDHFETVRLRKDGKEVQIEVTVSPIRDALERIVGASTIGRDISVRKAAEKHLVQMEARYRGLLEAAPDAVVVVNQDGEIVLLNLLAEKYFGYQRDELIGQKVKNIIPEGFAERLIADGTRTAAEALAQQMGTGIELTGRRKDGSEFPIEIMLSPLESAEGILVTAAIRDISVRKDAEKHLAQMEGRYRGLLEAAPDAMVVVDQAGEIVLLNVQAEKQFGYHRDELVGQKVKNIIPEGFAERLIADGTRTAAEALAQQMGTGIELTGRRKDGSEFPIEIMLSPLESPEGILVTAAIRDITERKQRENDLSRLAALAEDRLRALHENREQLQLLEEIATFANQASSVREAMQFTLDRVCAYTRWPIGHVYFAADGNTGSMVSTNIWHLTDDDRFDQFRKVTERTDFLRGIGLPGRVFASRQPAWISDVTDDTNFPRWPSARQAGLRAAFAFPVLNRNEVPAILEFFSETVSEPHPALLRIMFQIGTLLGRVVERVRAAEMLLHDAFHDPLTTLPNRALFLDRLARAIVRAERHRDYNFAVLFIDIDRFKIVNDSLGHPAGDDLLMQFSQRILRSLRLEDLVSRPAKIPSSQWKPKDDTLARLGGDEFTVLLDDIRDPSDAIRVAERIQSSFAEPFVICGQDVFTTASIGITANSAHATAVDVLRDADTAMYRAKLHGGARCEVFDQAMHEHSVNRLNLETDLRKALERKEFRVYYQPIIALRTGNISGFEALLRWQRPEKGLVSPAEFIGVAEETGLIVSIGKWVFRTACEQARQWHVENPQEVPLTMSVNISARQFMQDDLVAQVEKILRETQVEPTAIKLEITESVTMGDAERTIKVVNELKKLGLRFSIDDFGTGYSSLSYLRRFPMDTLKIDRSFVSNLKSNPENREIIRTIIGLARNLGMDVVAEGTETEEEISYLKTLDCDFAQGYFFSKPVDIVAARALLRENLSVAHQQSTAPVGPVNV